MTEQPPSAIPSTQEQNKSPTYGRGLWISYKVHTRSRGSTLPFAALFYRLWSQFFYEPMEEFSGIKEDVGFDHVEGFCTSLSNLYKSAATHRIDHNRWMITQISAYKSTSGVEHESLVVKAVCARMIVYVRIERKLHKSRFGRLFSAGKSSKASAKPQTSDDLDPSSDNTAYPRDATRPTPTPFMSKIASDEITYSQFLGNVVSNLEECVDVIEFPEGKGLSLPQIAVLARSVNSLGETYNLFDENCYWFAHIMVETAKLLQTDFKSSTNKKRGTWNGFLTTKKPTPELIGQAKSTFDTNWKAFNDDIYATINNENSEIYQKALQREENERRRREEAERKREEVEEENKRLREQLAALKVNSATANSAS